MTLSKVKSPAVVSLVGNDILFKINTDNQYSANGTNALLQFRFSDLDTTPGHKFKLAWGTYDLEFTLAATPDSSGLQLPVATAGQDLAEWVESLADALKQNYYLSSDFLIQFLEGPSPNHTIRLTAYEKDVDKSLTWTNDPTDPVINMTEFANTAGVNPVEREDYAIIYKTYNEANDNLGVDRLVPDDDGNVLFKIQEYLAGELSFNFEWPEGITTFLFKRTEQIKLFYVQYAETYENQVRKLFSTIDDPTYAILGGLDRNKLAELNESGSTWWDKLLYRPDFLTYQPREMYVSKDQPVKLSFLIWKEVTSIILNVTVTYTDGLSSKLIKGSINASQYEVIECILSSQKLGLGSVKDVDHYEVFLTDQDGNLISISRYFYIDDNFRENEKIFIFQNSLGSADVIRFTGTSEMNVELQRNSIEKINQDDFTWRNFEIEDHDNLEVQKFAFNTGWLNEIAKRPKRLADYLREFYLSPKIYEVVNNRLYPTRITSKKQFIDKSDETLAYLEFEAERAYTDKYFSQDENIHPSTGFEDKFIPDEFLNP